jgi:DNA polymerase delta subunit 1
MEVEYTYQPVISIPERDIYTYKSLRPDVPRLDSSNEDFELFLTESEYKIIPGRGLQIFLYGDTLLGNSVTVKVHGFDPYFAIKAPEPGLWGPDQYDLFQKGLEEALAKKVGKKGDAYHYRRFIKGLSFFWGDDLYDYHGEEPEKFIKIEVAYPALVRECRLLLEYPRGRPKSKYLPEIEDWWPQELPCPVTDPYEEKEKHSGYPRYFHIYEANLDYMIRFQVDHKIRATGWVKLKKGQYNVCSFAERDSNTQIEIVCGHEAVCYSERTTKQLPPISAYSYDAECETAQDGGFPKAVYYEKDKDGKEKKDKYKKSVPIPGTGERMLQMGFKKMHGTTEMQGIHMIGNSGPVKDADEVYCYNNELNFLRGFKMDIQASDPTFLVHYNGANFDNPYLIDRLKQTGLWESFGDLGRLYGVRSNYKNTVFNSSAHSTEKYATNVNGRIQIDVMQCIKREKKLRSYGLNAVSNKFLGKSKVEMDYHNINTLQEGTPEDRAKLAYYCIIDATLPWALIVKLKMIVNYLQVRVSEI